MDGVTNSVYTVANCLLEWLNALRTPVIPEEYLVDLTYNKNMNTLFADTLLAMVRIVLEVDNSFPRKIEMFSFI